MRKVIAAAAIHRLHIALLLLIAPLAAGGADGQALDSKTTGSIEFRAIGPAHFGGRITDIELHPDDPHTIFVAGASGGLFKTVNNGTTWECIFQNEGTISIGDIAVDPRNPDVIWVGSGEANNQRSSYWGDGVYKTTDGGKTWTSTGLRDSHHIGRIIIDPENSDIVYAAALGHLYTFNEERGLYKTTDGGQTWRKILYISEAVGVVDVVVDPVNSDNIYAASYERLRRAWHFDGAGPGSAVHKSTDGGQTWRRLEGGLPSGEIGRIGLAIYPKNPNILYADVSNQNPQPREEGERAVDFGFDGTFTQDGFQISEVREEGPAAQAGIQVGDIVIRLGEVEITSVWTAIRAFAAAKAGQEVEIVLRRGDEEVTTRIRIEAGDEERDVHGIPARVIGGEIYRSEDAGESWTKMNEEPIGGMPPYYYGQIRIDPADDQRIYVCSVPLFASSDGGRTWTRNLAGSVHVDHHALVVDPRNSSRLILGNDGGLAISYDKGATWDHYQNLPLSQFYAVGVDGQIPYHVYGGTQDNGTWGGPSHSRSGRGISGEEWYLIGGGDGFYAQVEPDNPDIVYGESQFGGLYRLNKRTGESRFIRPRDEEGQPPLRFNWNSPVLISHHNPQIIYFGGSRLFKSLNRGDDWPIRSPDLTTADEEKIKGNVPHCTITTIAESAIDPNLLLVGTDDGLVQISEDGGVTWTNLAGRFPGAPANWWVSRVELSRHDRNVAWVSFTGYREDDFRPFLYMTTNGGKNWENITNNLPDGSVNVVREDPRNPNVLWVGTEFGAFVSFDRGTTWSRLSAGLPTIPVHDLCVHARDRDLVLATHGRGFFIADVSPVQELSEEVLARPAHLFEVEDAYQWNFRGGWGGWSGNRHFIGENAPYGAAMAFYLKDDVAEGAVSLVVEDAAGKVVRTLEPPREAGLHRVIWNFRGDPPPQEDEAGGDDDDDDEPQERRRRRGRRAPFLGPGSYVAVLKVNGEEFRQSFEVRRDPMLD